MYGDGDKLATNSTSVLKNVINVKRPAEIYAHLHAISASRVVSLQKLVAQNAKLFAFEPMFRTPERPSNANDAILHLIFNNSTHAPGTKAT
jgi:hypothetical protein